MSLIDPSGPAWIPPGGQVIDDGTSRVLQEANQTCVAVLTLGSFSASTASSALSNFGCKGALFLIDLTGLPGSLSTTVALKLQTFAAGGRTATFAQRAALSATGMAVFMVYPGISASAGGVSSPLPRTFTALLSLSTGATSKDVALTLSMCRLL